MKKNLITSIGSTMLDIMYYTDEGRILTNKKDVLCPKLLAFEHAAKIGATDVYFTAGGGASNTAATFASLGLRPSILTALGSDPVGLDCVRNFKQRGIAVNRIQKYNTVRTGTSFIVSVGKRNDHVVFVYRGASSKLECSRKVLNTITSDWLYLTALTGNWKKNVFNIQWLVHKKNKKLVWNPGTPQIRAGVRTLKPLMQSTQLFIVNLDEALELLKKNKKIMSSINPKTIVKKLTSLGPRMAVLTMGHKGAYLCTGSKIYFQPAKKGRVANKTGAGDAFGAGLVSGLIKFDNIARALKLAMYNSHSVISKIGAQSGILSLRDLKKLKI